MKKTMYLAFVAITLISCQSNINNQVNPSPVLKSSSEPLVNKPTPDLSPTPAAPGASSPPIFTSSPDNRLPCPPENIVDEYRNKSFSVKNSILCIKSYGRKSQGLQVSPNGNILALWQIFPTISGYAEYEYGFSDDDYGPLYMTRYDNSLKDSLSLLLSKSITTPAYDEAIDTGTGTIIGHHLSINDPEFPNLAVNEKNELLVSWIDSRKLLVQKYDSNLTPEGQKMEFTPDPGKRSSSSIAINNNGDMFIAYADEEKKVDPSNGGNGGDYAYKLLENDVVRGKFYNSSGLLIKEINLNYANVIYAAAAGDNSFIIAYRERKSGSNISVVVQKYNNQGEPVGSLLRLDTGVESPIFSCCPTQITLTPLKNGSFIVGWLDTNSPNNSFKFKLFNKNNGLLKNIEMGVSAYDIVAGGYPNESYFSISSYNNGDFVILTPYLLENQSKFNILSAEIFDNNGEVKKPWFRINDQLENQGDNYSTRIERVYSRIDENDNLTVVWPEAEGRLINAGTEYNSTLIYDYKMKMKKYDSNLKQVFSGKFSDLPVNK